MDFRTAGEIEPLKKVGIIFGVNRLYISALAYISHLHLIR